MKFMLGDPEKITEALSHYHQSTEPGVSILSYVDAVRGVLIHRCRGKPEKQAWGLTRTMLTLMAKHQQPPIPIEILVRMRVAPVNCRILDVTVSVTDRYLMLVQSYERYRELLIQKMVMDTAISTVRIKLPGMSGWDDHPMDP